MSSALVTVGSALTAILLTGLIRRHAPRYGLLDVPNVRSSHDSAVPRGGGLAVAMIVVGAALMLTLLRRWSMPEALAWLGGGSLIAAAGLLDDRRGLSVRSRLLAQLLAALTVVWVWSAGSPAAAMSGGLLLRGAVWLTEAVAIVWAINLFNFMDGIDGLAAQQALFVSGAALLLGAGPPGTAEGWMLYCVAGATAGFLLWNWAPARIFMGDVGSGFLGFVLALSTVATVRNGSLSPWTWLILQAAFIVDATVTVCVRALRREQVHSAHRQHAYQRLARHWRSHARVTLTFATINVLWLLPLATASTRRPQWAPWLAVLALVTLGALALIAGAGRPGEIRPDTTLPRDAPT
jgi:Fuc2NAc and GlcNAc transferase